MEQNFRLSNKLFVNRVNSYASDFSGKKPVDLAIKNEHEAVVALLKKTVK